LPGHGQPGPGNPHARHVAELRAALFAEVVPERFAAVVRSMTDLAIAGDVAAARLLCERCLGRVAEIPADGDEPTGLPFELPSVATAAGVLEFQTAAVEALARGDISSQQAQHLLGVGEMLRRTIETTTLEARVRALEELEQ
jgi:hypothetical protein